jgi:hypothetical protein
MGGVFEKAGLDWDSLLVLKPHSDTVFDAAISRLMTSSALEASSAKPPVRIVEDNVTASVTVAWQRTPRPRLRPGCRDDLTNMDLLVPTAGSQSGSHGILITPDLCLALATSWLHDLIQALGWIEYSVALIVQQDTQDSTRSDALSPWSRCVVTV